MVHNSEKQSLFGAEKSQHQNDSKLPVQVHPIARPAGEVSLGNRAISFLLTDLLQQGDSGSTLAVRRMRGSTASSTDHLSSRCMGKSGEAMLSSSEVPDHGARALSAAAAISTQMSSLDRAALLPATPPGEDLGMRFSDTGGAADEFSGYVAPRLFDTPAAFVEGCRSGLDRRFHLQPRGPRRVRDLWLPPAIRFSRSERGPRH